MSAPNNLEGAPPTTEERAAMARELDAVAPTPGDKFRLMLGQRPTPRTDAAANESIVKVYETSKQLERELAEAREEGEEQARLLGMSGEREAGLLAEIDRLKRERNQARGLLKYANKGAERNAEALRISSEKLNEARGQKWRLAEACRWAQRELGKHTRPSPIDKALAALKGGTDA